jgi:hypothetical protein
MTGMVKTMITSIILFSILVVVLWVTRWTMEKFIDFCFKRKVK